MIKFQQFNDKYSKQVYDLIYNIMIEEIKIDPKLLLNTINDLNNINDNYIKNGGNFWIAIDTDNDKVIGTVGILKTSKDSAEFKRFYVDKKYRNNHIGFELYNIAVFYAECINIKKLYLVSSEMSKKALNIYVRNGWKMVNKNNKNINTFVRPGAMLYEKNIKNEIHIKLINKYTLILSQVG